ncbi:PQQ-binding-like beta-propeller repeat protein [Rhodoferax sp.]|uniref:PQQ-binding-like beta-propeller repeat protein n=1 Tax=Rhodoferax sp. TaxID=50421 RepID=UPI00262AAF16|nr:PQQ-binding-like beta-propeller repeat protein [Rhodoferax sp.]MDD2920256.1 PQQ-binding-like beta-propeller repeat protein [Rhodoferax sp.]
MNRNWQQFILAVLLSVIGGLIPAVFSPAFAQAVVPEANRSVPQDWSHKHLIYTNPETLNQAARQGTVAFDRWLQKIKDPRFAMAVAKKTAFVQPTGQNAFSGQQMQWATRFDRHQSTVTANPIQRDWSSPLGGASGVGRAGVFPAKFSFDINAVPSCANDFVVFTTASAGAASSSQAAASASQSGTFLNNNAVRVPSTITIGGVVFTATNGTGFTSTTYAANASAATEASNLAGAINLNSSVLVSAVANSPSSGQLTITAKTPGNAGNSILLSVANTARFSWDGAMTGGADALTPGQPTIVAFNNLYKTTCGPALNFQPNTMWSYNTGAGAFTETSPVLSLDGTQVAFVQRTGTVASLVLLKWSSAAPGTLGAPTAPTPVTAADYRTCTAPCMALIPFSGSPNNTNSSPYVDYSNDVLYVGTNNGTLHKFTGVFTGTPGEITAGGWPATVRAASILSSPVYDSVSNLVFVGTASTDGRLYAVNASTGAVVRSVQLSRNTNTNGIKDAPIVDSSAQHVYAFGGRDTSTGDSTVYRFSTTFTNISVPEKAVVGSGGDTSVLYSGAFNDAYYTTGNGFMYVCGSATRTARRPTLWRISVNSGNPMGVPATGPTLVNSNADCSPVTEIMNGANDYIYASVTAAGNDFGCTGACIYMYNLTGLTWDTAATAGAGLAAPGGTGGIIVDNISATAGASQIYYSTIGNGTVGNAIQASQAALQ